MRFRKAAILLSTVVVILALGFYALRYRRYAYAAAWHCFHSNNVKVGEHQFTIPTVWWVEKKNAGRISVVRACKSTALVYPEIEVDPVSEEAVVATDDEQSRRLQEVVSTLNLHSQPGFTASFGVVKSKVFVWSCVRMEETILGRNFSTQLICHASRIPYSLDYQGPPEREAEAKSIFASFQ